MTQPIILKSFYEPTPYYSYQEKRWYLLCNSDGSGWVPVDKEYTRQEILKIWEKTVYQAKETIKKVLKNKQTYFVDGSKGNKYEVVNDSGKWSCSCPAFGFSRGNQCKHIKQLINQ
jgi:hypothetical protein